MPCPSDSDHRVVIAAGETPTTYRLTFGTLLRQGVIHETDPDLSAVTADHGRQVGGTYSIAAGKAHTFVADGPIRLQNKGAGPLTVTINDEEHLLEPPGILSTSCPTERRRKVMLGALAGGFAATVLPVS